MKRAVQEAAVVLLITLFLALVVNGFRPEGIRLFIHDGERFEEDGGPAVAKEISLEKAVAMYEGREALFFDARSPDAFSAGHIKGAHNYPEKAFDHWIDNLLTEVDPEAKIITYCDGTECPLAENLAQKLWLLGYENVYHLRDGWGRWKARGLPAESE
jgi:rhodanese-related sulfurtransferase